MVMEAMTGLGYSIIALAILIGVGILLIGTMGNSLAGCGTGYSYQTNGTQTYATGYCCSTTSANCTLGQGGANPSTATQNLNTMNGYLGTSSGGLASWIPLIIILVIGMFFLGAFLAKKGKSA
jgi:hypothetical protein